MDSTAPARTPVRAADPTQHAVGREPGERSFSWCTRLAVRALDAPIAFVVLARDGGLALGCHTGLGHPWAPSQAEPPLSTWLRGGVGATAQPLVVDDVRGHPGTARDRALLALGARASIAVPLIASDGEVLGALCVADTRHRVWTGGEVEALSDLAVGALREMEGEREQERRRRAEAALGRSEHRFRLLAENIQDVFWITDPATDRLVYASPRFEAIWGRPVEAVQGDRAAFLQTIHPEDRARVVATAERVRHGATQEDYRILRPDGEVRWIRDRAFAAVDERGEVHRIVGVAEDITERKQEELAQRLVAEAGALLASSLDTQQVLRTIAELAVPALADHCLVDVVDDHDRIEHVEIAVAPSLKRSTAERLRRHYGPGSHQPDSAARVLRVREPLLLPQLCEAQLAGYAADPAHLDLLHELGVQSLLAVPLTAHGRVLGAITLVMGTSARRFGPRDLRLAQELARLAALAVENARLYRQAQRATRAREELLAVVSHELKSPLTALQLMLDMVLDLHPPEVWRSSEREWLQLARRSAEQMTRLVRDLTDITRIESGLLAIRPRPVEAEALIDDAKAAFHSLAAAQSLNWEVRLPDILPLVLADRQRVLQVFSNLIGNAVRATPAGGAITLGAEPVDGGVRFFVADTGEGIHRDHLPRLFESFWQAAGPEREGIGLGLPIARGIVVAHGGSLDVESAPGEGSTFSFTLPSADAMPAVAQEGDPQSISLDCTASLPSWTSRVPAADAPDGEDVPRADPALQRSRFLAAASRSAKGHVADAGALTRHLREHILTALHLGDLRAGDRLPSIRQLASALGAPYQSVVQAYSVLQAEGVVEKRNRSGIFVAPQSRIGLEPAGETSRWVADVLMQAFEHQIKIPRLPELIRRLTAAVPLRCVCVESTEDDLTALCSEMVQQFGMEARAVSVAQLPHVDAGGLLRDEQVPDDVRAADLLVTTVAHAPLLRGIAAALAKPLVVVTVHPEVVASIERRLGEGRLTVVCADPAFGDQVLAFRGGEYRDRIRVVLASDAAGIAALDRSEPVLLTRAASRRLPGADLRLIVPFSPFIAPASARDLMAVLIRLNLAAGRA